ncbi:MAG: hypothetical protein JWO81_567 [Alphaproteobacteria bacterium]|nr:hypothetical protein [Alphaproteobacteria bacterium]
MSGTLLRTVAFFAMISAATAAAAAPKPQLLKRHGIVYAIRGLEDLGGCKDSLPNEYCETYTLLGTIVSVDWPEGFMLRTANGRTKYQNIVSGLPAAADALIRPGRRVRVSGSMSGHGQVAIPSEIIAVGKRYR